MLKCNLQYVFSDDTDKGRDQGVDIDAVFILNSNSTEVLLPMFRSTLFNHRLEGAKVEPSKLGLDIEPPKDRFRWVWAIP